MAGTYRFEGLTLRQSVPGIVEATWARLDRASNRMIFTHLADLVGDLDREVEVTELMGLAAAIHATRVREMAEAYFSPPQVG